MEYNIEYINLKFTLINCFLVKVDENVLDISYSVNGNEITIQVVLLEGFTLSHDRIDKVKESLGSFDVSIAELYITKELFNESKGEWQPQCFKWLDYLLFSKAEIL